MSDAPRRRLRYVDWLRGLAVILMMQTHAYDAWLSPAAKDTTFFWVSRYIGGYPAALFLFLAGVSLALVAEGARRKGQEPKRIARDALGRAGLVLVYAVLFRLWMYAMSGFRGHDDLFRVDVLNCIGLSLALLSVLLLPRKPSRWLPGSVLFVGVVALATPWAWDAPWPGWVPPRIGGYWSGRYPNALFPIFPWAAYTAAGAALGFLLAQWRETKGDERPLLLGLGLAGALAIPVGLFLDGLPLSLGPRYDFWWTSPNYFLIKIGILLVLVLLAFLFDRTRLADGPSLVRTLGQASLLVYWVHIEIVYGALVAPNIKGQLGVADASVRFVILVLAMTALAAARLRIPKRRRRS